MIARACRIARTVTPMRSSRSGRGGADYTRAVQLRAGTHVHLLKSLSAPGHVDGTTVASALAMRPDVQDGSVVRWLRRAGSSGRGPRGYLYIYMPRSSDDSDGVGAWRDFITRVRGDTGYAFRYIWNCCQCGSWYPARAGFSLARYTRPHAHGSPHSRQ